MEDYEMSEPGNEFDDAAYLDDEDEPETYSKYDDDDEVSFLKTPKLDGISALPDSIIHHILSFLPTSKDAVKTGVLSKRWDCLWTSVSNLIFRYNKYFNKNIEGFLDFIDKTLILYSSPKIKKFILDFNHEAGSSLYCRIDLWIRFVLRHDADQQVLLFQDDKICCYVLPYYFYNNCTLVKLKSKCCYVLPYYFYSNCTLVKLKSKCCAYTPKEKVCWNSLKSLVITNAVFVNDAVNKILQGSPILEYLELHDCFGVNNLDITSKILKKLMINGICDAEDNVSIIEISAPNLQSLEILGRWNRRKCRLMNVSSLVAASLNFELTVDEEESDDFYGEYRNMLKELLEKVDHVKELTLGTWCIQVLSISAVTASGTLLSNHKCLILDMHFDEWDLPGLAGLLQSSPKLEKLVIDMSSLEHTEFDMHPNLYISYHFRENYWISKKWIFKCLLMHLKTIEIVGIHPRSHGYKRLLAFIQFLLSNAKVLEKMVITDHLDGDGRKHDYYPNRMHDLYEVAQKLLNFPRSSPRAVILLPK